VGFLFSKKTCRHGNGNQPYTQRTWTTKTGKCVRKVALFGCGRYDHCHGITVRSSRQYISAKREEAEDHIWSVTEDPSCFQDCVYDWWEHRPEQILDVSGKKHPDLGKPIFWERILDLVATTAYSNLIKWDIAEKEAIKVSA
jgi:hypothetical protein